MAFQVGALEGVLRINISQFQQGLKQAAQETQQKARQLSDTLHVKARLDTAPLTQGLAQAQRQAAQASAGLTRTLTDGGRAAPWPLIPSCGPVASKRPA
jgi:hypothetical protein